MSTVVSGRDIVSLGDRQALDHGLVGAKAARLAGLVRAGFDVPDGIVVSGAAGDAAVRAGAAMIAERLPSPWAVRSSAEVEDGPRESEAGRYLTLLGVVGGGRLFDAVTEVRLFGAPPRAAHAVLVQSMIPARAAGVAFSRHPVTGDPGITVIEATAGLGAPVNEGTCTPEHHELDLRLGSVRTRRGHRRSRLDVDPRAGIRVTHLDPPARTAPVLGAADLDRVAALAWSVRRVLDTEVDIEWVLGSDGDRLLLLQARPITTG